VRKAPRVPRTFSVVTSSLYGRKEIKRKVFWLGILISVIFLVLVFYKINFKEFFFALKKVNFFYVFLALLISLSTLFIRSIRWYYLLYPQKKVALLNLISATCVGLAMNNLFPFRLGDLIQAYFLGRKEKMSRSAIFSTVVLERFTDLIFLISIFFIVSFFFALPKQVNITVLVIFILGLVTFFIFLIRFQEKSEKFGQKIISFFSRKFAERFVQLFHSFISGFKVLRQGHLLLRVFFISFILWFVYILTVYVMFFAFGINLPFSAAMFFLAIVGISVTIPSSPGYVGTWEFFGVLALSFYQINKELALSFTLVHHLLSLIEITLLGLFFILKESISFQEIKTGLAR